MLRGSTGARQGRVRGATVGVLSTVAPEASLPKGMDREYEAYVSPVYPN